MAMLTTQQIKEMKEKLLLLDDYNKKDMVRTNIDLHPDIIKRLKLIGVYCDSNGKNIYEAILTSLALEMIPEL